MARTSNIYIRVEPEIKEQAEQVLERLGIPMSNAIAIFLRQVIMQKGIPFDVKLPSEQPLDFGSLSEKEFNDAIEKGMSDLVSGKLIAAEEVRRNIDEQLQSIE